MTTRFAFLLVCAGCATTDPAPPAPEGAAVVPAGIRRLTSYEYDRVASQLLGREVTPGRDWPGDVTQQGFSRNRGQIVDSVLAARLDDGARFLSRRARAGDVVLTAGAGDVDRAARLILADLS